MKAVIDHLRRLLGLRSSSVEPKEHPSVSEDLITAVKATDLDAVEAALSSGADPDSEDQGTPALVWAACVGSPEIVKLLLQAGADREAPAHDQAKTWALKQAASTGDLKVLQVLLDFGADPNRSPGPGDAPLAWAAGRGHVEALDVLIRAGAEVDRVSQEGYTAIDRAVAGNHEEVVRRLLKAGADPNLSEASVILAAQGGHREVAELLLRRGASVNQVHGGMTPLKAAVNWGDPKVVQLLLRYDPAVDYQDPMSGFTALMQWTRDPSVRCHELLIEHGADLELTNAVGQTALIVHAHHGRADIVELLLNRGADFEVRDVYGNSALDMARSGPSEEVDQVMWGDLAASDLEELQRSRDKERTVEVLDRW